VSRRDEKAGGHEGVRGGVAEFASRRISVTESPSLRNMN
jgi:hypothetical protein